MRKKAGQTRGTATRSQADAASAIQASDEAFTAWRASGGQTAQADRMADANMALPSALRAIEHLPRAGGTGETPVLTIEARARLTDNPAGALAERLPHPLVKHSALRAAGGSRDTDVARKVVHTGGRGDETLRTDGMLAGTGVRAHGATSTGVAFGSAAGPAARAGVLADTSGGARRAGWGARRGEGISRAG